jgi:hypothetical protein
LKARNKSEKTPKPPKERSQESLPVAPSDPKPKSPADKKFDLREFGDLNDIETFNSIKVKLELNSTEFKIFNRGLNEATPTNEMEICAVKFFSSYKTRYTAIKPTTGAAPSDPKPKSPADDQQSQNGSDKPPDNLSKADQQKVDIAIKQQKSALAAEFYAVVDAQVQKCLEQTIGPKLQEEQTEARRIIESRKGIMDRKAYKKILSCLHPDRVTDPTQKAMYEEAFRLFNLLEKRVLDEKNSPTQFVNIPKTRAEWDELKRQASERKKNKRKTQNGIVTAMNRV